MAKQLRYMMYMPAEVGEKIREIEDQDRIAKLKEDTLKYERERTGLRTAG
jgi:hypothetical protein